MKILRQYWKVLLIAAGVITSAAFYVKEAPEDESRLLLLAEGEELPEREEEEGPVLFQAETPVETLPETKAAEGFSDAEKEELRALLHEVIGEEAGEAVREALREEIHSMMEDGRFTKAVSEYTETQAGLVNINTADREELKTLSGIGDAKASAILSYREEHGDFASVDELVNVSGISAGLLDKIRDQLTL